MNKGYKEITLSAIPALLFLLVFKYVSYKAALIVGFVFGILVFSHKYKVNGELRSFDRIGIYGLIIQSVISLIAENPRIYFLYPLVQNIVVTIVFIGSLLWREDACSYLAKDYVKSESIMKLMRPTYRKLTYMWSLYYIIKIVIKVFGLINWSFEKLYVVSWLFGTPVSVALLLYTFTHPQKVYEKISLSNSESMQKKDRA